MQKVVCGAMHTLVLTEEKEVFSFGSGNHGECGQGDLKDVHIPTFIKLQK